MAMRAAGATIRQLLVWGCLEDALTRYVLLAFEPVTNKRVQRVVGKLVCCCRPAQWSHLFLAGPIAHTGHDGYSTHQQNCFVPYRGHCGL